MTQLSDEKINLLRQNARCMVRELGLLNDAYFEIGVTLAERHLLIELASTDTPLTAKEIAQRLLLDKSTVSRLVAKAIKKGYITCKADPNDKRKRYLAFTKLGKTTLNAFEPIAFDQTKRALETLSTSEIQLVHQGMALYAQGLRNSRLQPPSKEIPPSMESLEAISDQLFQMGYTLDSYQLEDESELYTIFKEVVETGSQFPYECSSMQEFKNQFFATGSKVYVCRSAENQVVGGFYLKPNYSGRSDHIANAAYMISSSHRGLGIGTLIIKASLHLAKSLGFQSMQFNMVFSENTLAIKLYEKLGFDIIGTIPNAIRNPDGSFQDGHIMFSNIN